MTAATRYHSLYPWRKTRCPICRKWVQEYYWQRHFDMHRHATTTTTDEAQKVAALGYRLVVEEAR